MKDEGDVAIECPSQSVHNNYTGTIPMVNLDAPGKVREKIAVIKIFK